MEIRDLYDGEPEPILPVRLGPEPRECPRHGLYLGYCPGCLWNENLLVAGVLSLLVILAVVSAYTLKVMFPAA